MNHYLTELIDNHTLNSARTAAVDAGGGGRVGLVPDG